MTKTISTEKARQGGLGRQVLIVLVAALGLAALVWAGAELYGEAIAPPNADQPGAPATGSPEGTPAPATQPQGTQGG